MKLTTNSNDRIKLEKALVKAERLTKLYKCSLLDLMVLSIRLQAENKKAQIKK